MFTILRSVPPGAALRLASVAHGKIDTKLAPGPGQLAERAEHEDEMTIVRASPFGKRTAQ